MQHEPRRYPNHGRAPVKWPPDTRIQVRWSNGQDARHTYTVEQLRWTLTGSEFEVDLFWKA
jgi:hypothetical protein